MSIFNTFATKTLKRKKPEIVDMSTKSRLIMWQGQKDWVSPAGSVGASEYLRYSEVSTGHPHPSTRGFGAKSTLSVKPRVKIQFL